MTELRRFRPRLARRPSAPAAPFCFERASLELFARRRQRGAPWRPAAAGKARARPGGGACRCAEAAV
jgi:hypothetical protein